MLGDTEGAAAADRRERLTDAEDATKVVVVGADGVIRSASEGACALLGDVDVRAGERLATALEAAPELAAWIAAAAGGDGDRCVREGVEVRYAPLDGDGSFALVVTQAEGPAIHGSLVSQKEWHDIKNQLGGLKLYATFLKMKLASQDDMVRETTAKIVGGIDAVVRSIADVRRGPETTKGEDA